MTLLLLLFGRTGVSWWARWTASQQLRVGAISDAQQWLARAARLDPGNADTGVLMARSYRHLGRHDLWSKAIASADAHAAGADVVKLEKRLGTLRWGQAKTIPDHEVETLTEAGIDVDEAATAVVYGLLAVGDEVRAKRILESWESADHQPSQLAYVRGIHWQWKAEHERAKQEFTSALSHQPRHEMALAGLAQVLENQGDLEQSRTHFSKLVDRWPDSELALIGLSRVSRRLARADDSRRLLDRFKSSEDVSREVALELAEVQYQLGEYADATRWFDQIGLDDVHPLETLRVAASAYALQGRTKESRALFDRIYAAQRRSRRMNELQARVALDRSDLKAAAELQRLSTAAVETELETDAAPDQLSALFSLHCAACHGEEGDGNGRAAAGLYPRPRNLRRDHYRLISTTNGFPSEEDIEAVIRHGIPGTAMPSFAHLPAQQLRLLAAQTYQLRREGLRAQLVEGLRRADEAMDQEAIDRLVQERTTPGPQVVAPPVAPATAEEIAEGALLYRQMSCDRCHGPDGRGVWDVALFDEEGVPSIPRDLAYEPNKGGDAPSSLFARLRLGMPGTPHPANPTLSDQELAKLVAYCLSLSKEPKPALTNHQRAKLANARARQAQAGVSTEHFPQ